MEQSVRELGIRYPVGQDNGYATWRAWGNRAWPSFYLLDRDGGLVMLREGEGHGFEMEQVIRGLLDLSPAETRRRPSEDMDLSRIRTPEMYFGALHPTPQEAVQSPRLGEGTYAFSQTGPRPNRYELDGRWVREEEPLVLRFSPGRMRMRYSAAKVHLVARAPEAAPVRARTGTGLWRSVEIGRPKLYTVVDGDTYGEQMLEIEVAAPGLALYSATFGLHPQELPSGPDGCIGPMDDQSWAEGAQPSTGRTGHWQPAPGNHRALDRSRPPEAPFTPASSPSREVLLRPGLETGRRGVRKARTSSG